MQFEKKSIWQQIDKETNEKIYEYSENYKNFLDSAKTEREATNYIISAAKDRGFISLEEALKGKIKSGDRIYLNNKNKSVVLFIMGEEPLEEGLNIVGSHIDSPRLDLKGNPLYQDSSLALLKTHYYGGIKKYQWPTIALSLHGYFRDVNGIDHNICIGEDDTDPIFYINDLLPHLSKTQNSKNLKEAIEGEQLNIVVGHSTYGIEGEENPIKRNILSILKEKYNLDEEDFAFAEFEAVPAQKARDVGFDRAMIASHGHDDRVCSYANLKAALEVENPKKTAVALFVDKEEIGSVGNTAMTSMFFENALAEIINNIGEYSDLKVRRTLANSSVLSADVSAALDPSFKDVSDEKNEAQVGYGIAMAKYTGSGGKGGSNDANAEYICKIRDLFRDENVIWQISGFGKVDQGGGGTIAYILAKYGAEVVDMGTAMLSMHAPVELVSKADAYMTYRAYKAFMDKFE